MVVVEEKPVPIYETKCGECKSIIRYRKSEVGTTNYIICPVCGMSIWADVRTPVDYWGDGKQTNADYIRSMSDKELAEWIGDNIDCVACVQNVFGTAECPKHTTMKDCYGVWLDWLREEYNE